MDRADIITNTSISLYLQKSIIEGRKNAYLSRNAVNEIDFILENNEIPSDLIDIPEPRVVYSGVIYERFDKELFYSIVKSNPDKSFVIIGFQTKEILDEEFDNIYFLGPKKHSDLKKYLSHCQVGIIPFRDDTDMIISCDSIKQYEYIACGLPVITTNMPEAGIEKINTYIAKDVESFNYYLNFCLNNNLSLNEDKVIEFLTKNSWNERVTTICKIIDKEIDYNYNNVILSNIRDSLNSPKVKENPQFKILNSIILLNDDKRKFLEEAEKAYLKLKIKFIERWYVYSLIMNESGSLRVPQGGRARTRLLNERGGIFLWI